MIAQHYNENHGTLIKKLSRRVGGPYNAGDVVQEAYARALRFFGSYDKKRDFNKWFNTILNNATRDFKRDERLQGRHVDVTDENLGEQGLVWPHDSDLLRAIQEDIKALSHPDRDIMHLYFNQQYTPREIGQVVHDVTPTYLRQKVHVFKKEMKEKYDG